MSKQTYKILFWVSGALVLLVIAWFVYLLSSGAATLTIGKTVETKSTTSGTAATSAGSATVNVDTGLPIQAETSLN